MKTKDLAASRRMERPRIEVRVASGPDKGLSAVLAEGPMIVGTGEDADLRLTDETVSAHHCELSWREGRLVVRDLQSTNGVLLDGIAIGEAFPQGKCRLVLAQTALALKPLESEEVVLSGRRLFGPLYGESPAMRALFAQLEAVAKSDAPLLLEGETGTGKDLTAEAVHRASNRTEGPYVVFDCGAASGPLLESELFGHVRGAFTGADTAREGLAVAADGGTLLIDEVGELPLELQPKLLRLLERREVRMVGSNTARTVDARLIAATHRPLRQMVKAGTFREDLFFRLSALRVRLPSLRERPEDIPGLVDKMLLEHGSRRTFAELADADRALLTGYRWPGNVRELRNVVERLVAFPTSNASRLVDADELSAQKTGGGQALSSGSTLMPLSTARDLSRDAFERKYLKEALDRSKGSVSEAARLSQVSRQFFQRLMRKHGVAAGRE